MRFTKHSYWFFLLLSVMNLNFVYAELPPPRIWIYETSHDMTRKTKQMVRKFHGSLKQSMKRSKRLEVEDGKAIKRRDLNAEVSKAESYKYSGIEAFREKKYDEAQKILRSSLKLYSKHVASVKEVEAIFQTLIYLAASYTELEYDGDAKDYYRQLAAVAPKNFSLGKDFSAKVNKKYKKEQKRLLKKKRGMIEVKTTPPGAEVWVDGVKRCVSPCQVKDLVRGVHYIKVNKAKTGFNGGIVKVKAGWSTPVKYSLQKQPQGAKKQVVAASLLKQIKGKLEQAQIDAQFRQHAETIAQEQDVNFVLITHLMRDRRKVTLFSYLYGNESKRLFVIEPTTFSARFSAAQITAKI